MSNNRNTIVELTPEALERMTDEQLTAVARLVVPNSVKHLHVSAGGFDLPDGYLAFRYDYTEGHGGGSIYGGIGPDGAVST